MSAESGSDVPVSALEQTVLEFTPLHPEIRGTDDAEEVLFVISGNGTLRLDDARYELEPETGAYLRARGGVRGRELTTPT